MSTILNLEINQGETFSQRITGFNSAGDYFNLTGYSSISGAIKFRYGSSGELSNLNPVIHNSYVSGIVDISIPATGTAYLPANQLLYNIEIYSGVAVTRLFEGKVTVTPQLF